MCTIINGSRGLLTNIVDRWTNDESALASLTANVKKNMTDYAEYIENNLIRDHGF